MSHAGIPVISNLAQAGGDLFSGRIGNAVGDLAGAAAPFIPGVGGLVAGMAGHAMGDQPGQPSGYAGGGQPNPLGVAQNPLASYYAWNQILNPSVPGAAQSQQQLNLANQLQGAGTSLLDAGLGTGQGPALPQLQNMGALSGAPSAIATQAQLAGLNNPLTSQGGVSQQPGQLSAPFQSQYNSQADIINQGRNQAVSTLRQQLAANGITDPRALAAAEAQINTQHDQLLQQSQSGLQQQQYGAQTQAANQMIPELGQLGQTQIGLQGQNLGYGLQALAGRWGGAGEYYGDTAARNNAFEAARQSNIGRLLGLNYPGQGGMPGMPGYGMPQGMVNPNDPYGTGVGPVQGSGMGVDQVPPEQMYQGYDPNNPGTWMSSQGMPGWNFATGDNGMTPFDWTQGASF